MLTSNPIDSRERQLFLPRSIVSDNSNTKTKLNFLSLEGADITASAEIENFDNFSPVLGDLFEYDDIDGFRTIDTNNAYNHSRLTGAVQFAQNILTLIN